VPAWKTEAHLVDHYALHRGQLRARSIEDFDASAQETIEIGVRFTYTDRLTGEYRIGYFHRDSSRFAATTVDGAIVTHFQTDEDYVASLRHSTYRDSEEAPMTHGKSTQRESVTATSADEMVDKVYRDLVQIHAAIAERTTSDKEIMPWTVHELMSLIREIGAFRRQQRAAAASEPVRST